MDAASSSLSAAESTPSGSMPGSDVPTVGAFIICNHCAATTSPDGGTLSACAGCHSVAYCSEAHQKADWRRHRLLCKSLATKRVSHCGASDNMESIRRLESGAGGSDIAGACASSSAASAVSATSGDADVEMTSVGTTTTSTATAAKAVSPRISVVNMSSSGSSQSSGLSSGSDASLASTARMSSARGGGAASAADGLINVAAFAALLQQQKADQEMLSAATAPVAPPPISLQDLTTEQLNTLLQLHQWASANAVSSAPSTSTFAVPPPAATTLPQQQQPLFTMPSNMFSELAAKAQAQHAMTLASAAPETPQANNGRIPQQQQQPVAYQPFMTDLMLMATLKSLSSQQMPPPPSAFPPPNAFADAFGSLSTKTTSTAQPMRAPPTSAPRFDLGASEPTSLMSCAPSSTHKPPSTSAMSISSAPAAASGAPIQKIIHPKPSTITSNLHERVKAVPRSRINAANAAQQHQKQQQQQLQQQHKQQQQHLQQLLQQTPSSSSSTSSGVYVSSSSVGSAPSTSGAPTTTMASTTPASPDRFPPGSRKRGTPSPPDAAAAAAAAGVRQISNDCLSTMRINLDELSMDQSPAGVAVPKSTHGSSLANANPQAVHRISSSSSSTTTTKSSEVTSSAAGAAVKPPTIPTFGTAADAYAMPADDDDIQVISQKINRRYKDHTKNVIYNVTMREHQRDMLNRGMLINNHQAMVLRLRYMAEHVIRSLNEFGWAVVDNFLGPEHTRHCSKEMERLYRKGLFTAGQLMDNSARKGQPPRDENAIKDVRSDYIYWYDGVDPRASEAVTVRLLISMLDSMILHFDDRIDGKTIGGRSRAMLAIYPGKTTRYVKHVDNPNKDGRLITCIYYCNPGWDLEKHGGALRLFPETCETAMDVDPQADRLVFFWSDRRNPHEVMPVYRHRFAVTIWYMDKEERMEILRKHKIEAGEDPNEVKGMTDTTTLPPARTAAAAGRLVSPEQLKEPKTEPLDEDQSASIERLVTQQQPEMAGGRTMAGTLNEGHLRPAHASAPEMGGEQAAATLASSLGFLSPTASGGPGVARAPSPLAASTVPLSRSAQNLPASYYLDDGVRSSGTRDDLDDDDDDDIDLDIIPSNRENQAEYEI